jgi:hypothetical protein
MTEFPPWSQWGMIIEGENLVILPIFISETPVIDKFHTISPYHLVPKDFCHLVPGQLTLCFRPPVDV